MTIYSSRLPKDSSLRRKSSLDTGPGKCAQEFIQASDIKNIVKMHLKTGTPFPTAQGIYGDVSEIPQLQERLNIIRDGNLVYSSFPEMIKKLYPTPADFLAAFENPAEIDNLRKLGVLKEKAPDSNLSKPEPQAPSLGGTAEGGGAIAPSGTIAT